MAVSDALHASGGFTISISSDNVSYTEVAEVVDAEPPPDLVKTAKATHNASPDNATESKPGLSETGKGNLTINFTQDQYSTLKALRRTIRYWKFTYPLKEGHSTAATLVFLGYWTKLSAPKLDPEDPNVLLSMIELERSSGVPTFTAGS